MVDIFYKRGGQAHTTNAERLAYNCLLIGVVSILAIILSIVWTRTLASTAKVAVTIALILLVAVASVAFGIYGFYSSARSQLRNPSSDDESSLVDD